MEKNRPTEEYPEWVFETLKRKGLQSPSRQLQTLEIIKNQNMK
jgi:hypothetical protein